MVNVSHKYSKKNGVVIKSVLACVAVLVVSFPLYFMAQLMNSRQSSHEDRSISPHAFPVLFVNLEHRPERAAGMRDQLLEGGWWTSSQVERMPAVYGKRMDFHHMARLGQISTLAFESIVTPRWVAGEHLTAGAAGTCLLAVTRA